MPALLNQVVLLRQWEPVFPQQVRRLLGLDELQKFRCFPILSFSGATAWANATNPACALPDSTNCAACETFSPNPRRSSARSYMPARFKAATAARPYDACCGLAIAIFF